MTDLSAGTVVGGGRYEVVSLIGDGSMGEVFEALDVRLDRTVALKVLHARYRSHRRISGRIEKEARALATIDHRHVVRLYDVFDLGGRPALVLEMLKGGSLEERLDERGALPWSEVEPLAAALLAGLQAIHDAGFIHRDLKPGNVLFDADGTPKIADLGIAHDEQGTRMTRDGATIGTAEYMSPEQIQGSDPTAAADIYSAGVLLFELLAGRPPFVDDSEFVVMKGHVEELADLSLLPESVPQHVRDAVARALAKAPEGRFASAVQFSEALNSAPPPGSTGPLRDVDTDIDGGDVHGSVRRPRVWPVVALLVLALGGAGGWLGYLLVAEQARAGRLESRLAHERREHEETDRELSAMTALKREVSQSLETEQSTAAALQSNVLALENAKSELEGSLESARSKASSAVADATSARAELSACKLIEQFGPGWAGTVPDLYVKSDDSDSTMRAVAAFKALGYDRVQSSSGAGDTFRLSWGPAATLPAVRAIAAFVQAKTGKLPTFSATPTWTSETDDDVYIYLPLKQTGTTWNE